MKGQVPATNVIRVLKSMAAVFGELAKSKYDIDGVQAADELFNAAERKDAKLIAAWAGKHATWRDYVPSNLERAVRAVAVQTAVFFRLENSHL